jgi:hypothetical protein
MTFKDLKLQLSKLQSNTNQDNRLHILRNKPFRIWDRDTHLKQAIDANQQCCAQHIWGLPIKNNKEYPLFEYEKTIYDSLMIPEFNNPLNHNFKDKHLYVLKSTGLGISELCLRFMAWLAVRNNDYKNSQMVIITGPNLDLATKLVKRLKAIFEPKLGIIFNNKETVVELNGCTIESFPSNHLDSFRSLTSPKLILLDESDMFRKSEQEDVRHVSERYIGKSNPFLIMISTPNAPGGLMESIQKEPEETCIYKRLFMDYHYGLDRIFTREEIEKARMSPSFEREYCLKYQGKIGNLLSPLKIDIAIKTGERLKDIPVNPFCIHSLGVDPAFGSSAFGLVLTEHLKEEDKIRVLYAEQFENHPDPNDMINRIFEIHRQYHNLWIFVDAAARGFITSLKIAFNENPNYERPEDVSLHSNKIIPVNFSTEHKTMISHLAQLFNDEYIAIPDKFDKLIVSLKTAVVNEYTLDKEATSYDDLLDACRLSLKAYNIN